MDIEKAVEAYIETASASNGTVRENVKSGLLAAAPFLQEHTPAEQPVVCRHGKRADEPCHEGFCFRPKSTQPQPSEDVETARKMYTAFCEKVYEGTHAVPNSSGLAGMTAALAVAREGMYTQEQLDAHCKIAHAAGYDAARMICEANCKKEHVSLEDVEKAIIERGENWLGLQKSAKDFASLVCSRLQPAKVERVMLVPRTSRITRETFDVYLDGRLERENLDKKDAECYAAGLRAELEGSDAER